MRHVNTDKQDGSLSLAVFNLDAMPTRVPAHAQICRMHSQFHLARVI